MEKIQKLAKELYDNLATNDGGFIKLKEDAPEWMATVCVKAHDDFMPDDWRYKFIYECASKIADCEGEEQLNEARCDFEPDIWNVDLLRWLASNLARPSYCDEAKEIYGDGSGIMYLIGYDQVYEKQEVFGALYRALEDIAND